MRLFSRLSLRLLAFNFVLVFVPVAAMLPLDTDDVRPLIVRVCLASLAAAFLLSLVVSATIARPLRRLRDEAEAILDRSGRLKGGFGGSTRRDEIGDLARALEELTRRLEEHVRGLETFASDVAHELKNPLTSIRSATEMLGEVHDPVERKRFLAVVLDEVARMEHQLSELAEITRIDARLEAEEQTLVPLNGLLGQIVERFRLRENGRVRFVIEAPAHVVAVRASPGRLTQVFENILDNAASFSPDASCVKVTLTRGADGAAVVSVEDEGPGVPQAHSGRIFDRFFSYRPGEERGQHAGLGLAIARAIAEGYGGSIGVDAGPGGGARFEIRLPGSG